MRYILFGGEKHPPSGGASNIFEIGESVDSLSRSNLLEPAFVDWWHIYDLQTKTIVIKRGCFGDEG